MLSIRGLCHAYGKHNHVLNGIDLNIPKGLFGLLGPNGAGKSTLMRILATLQVPTQGHIEFDGVDVQSHPQALRRMLGYLPQDFDVWPQGSAFETLDHIAALKGLGNRKQRRERVDYLLDQTNLLSHKHKRLASFSGGMKRRFGIAQALIAEPKLIIVDEPTAGLDPEERNRFHNLLAELGEDLVVILSTHIVEDISVLCPKLAVLLNGRIVAQGATEELLTQIDGQVWQTWKDSWPDRVAKISEQRQGGKLKFRVHARENPGSGFEAVEPSLEDIYFLSINGCLQ